jgi:hypothetical protein
MGKRRRAMPWSGIWIGIALVIGFYAGVTLMAVLAVARRSEQDDAEFCRISSDEEHAYARAVGGRIPVRRPGLREAASTASRHS